MGSAAKAIGAAFVASIGVDTVRAWADATKGALEFAGSLGETAQQLGVTTNELQEYRYVATQVGIDQAVMDKGLSRLSITLGQVAEGAKKPTAALEALGLSQSRIAEISHMTAGDALPALADAFAKIDSPTKQAAIAADLFGAKMGGKFLTILGEGSAALEKMRNAAHSLGIVISEEAIKNADANADLLSTYEQIATAQKNAALTLPENVQAYVAYEKTVTDLQVAFYKAIGSLQTFDQWAKRTDQSLREFGKNTGLHAFVDGIGAWFSQANDDISAWAKRTHDTIVAVPGWISAMVTSIGNLMTGALGTVWDRAVAKIETVKRAFFNLYDAVIGHSYIPDMVDGIAAYMAQLDSTMVKPAERATAATGARFQQLRDLLDRLFPEVGIHNDFTADVARIDGSTLGADQKSEAFGRRLRELGGRDPSSGAFLATPDFGNMGGPLVDGIDATSDAIARLTESSGISTVRIAESFKDMADKTLQSLSSLTSAIKGGGFLDILQGVIGLGLQLGSVGAFGKTIAGRINAPALASAPRSGVSIAKGSSGGTRVTVVPSPYFNTVVDGRAATVAAPMMGAASSSGSIGAQTALARRAARTIP
jgi:hypothetical protein